MIEEQKEQKEGKEGDKEEDEEDEERCEECDSETDETLVDVILNGEIARLCRRCAKINQAIIVEKPDVEQLAATKRSSIISAAERIARIPGLAEELRKNMPDMAPNEVTIGDLRRLQEEREGEEKQKEEKGKAEEAKEKEKEEVEKEEEKKAEKEHSTDNAISSASS